VFNINDFPSSPYLGEVVGVESGHDDFMLKVDSGVQVRFAADQLVKEFHASTLQQINGTI
jgi:hypothetical protein